MTNFKSNIIQEVFANKVKSNLSKNSKVTYADGGKTDSDVYSPIEFLHKFMKIVSIQEGNDIDRDIRALENDMNKDIEALLSKYRVNSVFMLPVDELEKINSTKRDIESRRMFITEAELDAYVMCNPDLPQENYVKKITYSKNDLVEQGLIMLDVINGSVNWVYKWQYLSGNIQEKISRCYQNSEEYKRHITEGQYLKQIAELESVRNPYAIITTDNKNKIFISPNSFFAKDKLEFEVNPDDYETFNKIAYTTSLANSFKVWIKDENEVEPSDFKLSNSKSVVDYYVDKLPLGDDRESINIKQNAQTEGQILFDKFLTTALNEKCRKRLEYVWNAKYNNFVEPKKYKIPVALSCGKKWKKDSDFRPNEPQIQSVQFIKDAGSGLLAYGVGVGKTASAILNMSYAFDNNISKKALLVVPNPTYEKWKGEIAGMEITEFTVTYTENSEVLTKVFAQEKDADKFSKTKPKSKITSNKFKLKGILPNVNIVGLYNLNKDVVFGLKEYTEKEKLEIANAEDLLIYLSKIAKDYTFDDSTINAEIENRYGNFELSDVIKSYNVYFANQTKAKKKAQPIFAWWKRSVTEYVNSLYYRLGKMKPVSDKTIFVTTFEGLSQLGVEELSIDQRVDINSNDSFFGKMYNELTQGDNLERLKYYGKSNAFADELEIMIYGGVGQNKIFLKELGIDYAIFDESHNFKKVFVTVKGKPKQNPPTYKDSGAIDREQKKYTMKMASSPSNRALSSYLVSRYVQIVNKNRGVIHLTATPFTNSPIEVYSMLALTNYEKLLKAGYKHIEDFFDSFMRIAYEIRFTASQTIQKDEVLVGYNNTPQLRTLIYSIMDYKNGDDANIKRPNKIMYPSVSKGREMTMMPNAVQTEYLDLIKEYIRGKKTMEDICDAVEEEFDIEEKTDEELINLLDSQDGMESQKKKYNEISLPLNEEDRQNLEKIITKIIEKDKQNSVNEEDLSKDEKAKFRILKGLSMIKQVTLSPYLFSCKKKTSIEPTYKEYVETSPKLLYIVNSIKSVKDYELSNGLKMSGSVIYMNLGVHPQSKILQDGVYINKKWKEGGFDKIKKYLVKELGYSESEVSIVKGTGMSIDEKEREKNKFLSGESTVIIGSSTISTGVDLQDNASSLFLASFDWNPTDAEQISGRIHRQGNRFANVRIVYPMVENSADPVIFQLLQEKTLRIKEIWDREGKKGELDLSDFDPKELKGKLITDPQTRTEMWIEEQTKEIEDTILMLESRLNNTLRKAGQEYSNLMSYREPSRALITVIDAYRKNEAKQKIVDRISEKTKDIEAEFVKVKSELFEKLQEDEDFAPKYSEELKKAKSVYEKGLADAKKGEYDYETDKENKYVVDDFSNATDEVLVNKIDNWVFNRDSWYLKNDGYDFIDKLNAFVSQKYPEYYEGRYVSNEDLATIKSKIEELRNKQFNISEQKDEVAQRENSIKREFNWNLELIEADERYIEIERTKKELDKEYNLLNSELKRLENEYSAKNGGVKVRFSPYQGGIVNYVTTFRNAVKEFNKFKQRLAILGIEADDIQSAQDLLNDEIQKKKEEKETIKSKAQEMFILFTKEYEDRKQTAPTVLERVDEFADAHKEYINTNDPNQVLITFKEDKQKQVVIEEKPKVIEKTPKEIIFVEPKKEEKPKGVLITSIATPKVESKESKSDLEFLQEKLEATQGLIDVLEMTDGDSKDLEYLKSLLETTKDLISLMELA
jgi:hypothetical protein